VIAEIVNISEDEKKKILGFAQSLKKKEGILENKLSKDIQEYTEVLLKRLSKIKIVEIEFSDLKSNRCSNGRYDVYGEITISFKQSGIKNTIVLGISKGHGSIDMQSAVMDFEDDRMEKLNEIAGSCKNVTEFVGNLFAAYVDYEVRKLDNSKKNRKLMKAQVRKTIENNFADINRLLLIKKINDLKYKRELVTCSIVYSMNQKLSPEHPIVRFTSNILGSTELDNWEIQWDVLPPIIFAGLLNKNEGSLSYPNINLPEEMYERIMKNIKLFWLVEYVLECDISIFIVWIKYCIENFDSYNKGGFYELFDSSVVYNIYEYIFLGHRFGYSNIVDKFITQNYPEEKDVILGYIHYTWFMFLILENNPNIELIKANFDAIQNPSYNPRFLTYYKNDITEALTELKDHLCTSEDSIAKFDELLHQYKPDPIVLCDEKD
ncbi:hypothetical protein NEAUS03_2431, partial [Nematocida ausubeli]